ncbi:MAG: NAD(P)H-binding protein [Pseudomonadota bacterium]
MSSPTIILLGATGTIGSAVLTELVTRSFDVHSFVRETSIGSVENLSDRHTITAVDFSDPETIRRALSDPTLALQNATVVSCLASRTGAPNDAKAIDYKAHSDFLKIAKGAGISGWVQLSAICVQKPRLAFQFAKLKFEAELMASGITYSIVRPTAYFKSLSGQADRLKAGKKFLVFGDGTKTACKPISTRDLATYIVDCIDNSERQNKVLPIGGPGPALTPIEQGRLLADAIGVPLNIQKTPLALFDVLVPVLKGVGALVPALKEKAALAEIGRYYARESMLVWDKTHQTYNADATPEFGTDTLAEHYRGLAAGHVADDRGAHKVF